MSQAWIPQWTLFSELSEEQLANLMDAQLRKESPNFYKEIAWLAETQEPVEFTKEVKDWGDNIINDVWGAKITSIKDDKLRNQVSSYISEKIKSQPNNNVALLKSNIALLEELESHPWLSGAIWVWTKWWIPATDSAWFMARLRQLEAKQFMEWIQWMKWMGSLSNAEWLKVSASISSLWDTGQSEADWKAELEKVKTLLKQKVDLIERDTWLKFNKLWEPITWEEELQVDNVWDYEQFLPKNANTWAWATLQ